VRPCGRHRGASAKHARVVPGAHRSQGTSPKNSLPKSISFSLYITKKNVVVLRYANVIPAAPLQPSAEVQCGLLQAAVAHRGAAGLLVTWWELQNLSMSFGILICLNQTMKRILPSSVK
jgi:hypothetical protein